MWKLKITKLLFNLKNRFKFEPLIFNSVPTMCSKLIVFILHLYFTILHVVVQRLHKDSR